MGRDSLVDLGLRGVPQLLQQLRVIVRAHKQVQAAAAGIPRRAVMLWNAWTTW